MGELCNLCVKPNKNKILLNEHNKNIIDMLLNWLKYKHDIKLYECICEECYEEILRINRFMDIIKNGHWMCHANSDDNTPQNNIELSSNVPLTSLNKRPRVLPKRFRDDSIVLSMAPIQITTNNNTKAMQNVQLIAELHVQDQPQIILADVNEIKVDDSTKCNFTCKFCQKECSTVFYLKQHVVAHLQDADKQNNLQSLMYNCAICKKAFKTQYTMRRHFKNAHNTEKLYKCHQCSATFKYKCNLTYHMARHTGNKPFKCLVCSKTFVLRYELLLHSRTHTGEKPHVCSDCGYSFAHRSNLVKHHRLRCKLKNLSIPSATQTSNNQENVEINAVHNKVSYKETEQQKSSDENLTSTFNNNNCNNNNILAVKIASDDQMYLLNQQQQEQIKQAVVKKVNRAKSESLLISSIAIKCNENQSKSEKEMQITESENVSLSQQKDLIPCVDTNVNVANNNTNVMRPNCENTTDLRIAKKPVVSQTKELDQKFLITQVEILPPLNVTTKPTLPIQNLIQVPTKYKYQCMICWKYFKRSYTFKKHVNTHTDDQSYQCRPQISDSPNYSSFRKRKGSHKKVSQASPLSKSPLNITCASPTCSIVSDPDPDGREIMQMIKTRENEIASDNNNSDDSDNNSLSSSSLENTMWEEALDKVLFQPNIMQNIRNNLSFTLSSAEQFM